MSGGGWLQTLGARIALIDSSVFLKNGSLPPLPPDKGVCPPPPFLTSFLFIVFWWGEAKQEGVGGCPGSSPSL